MNSEDPQFDSIAGQKIQEWSERADGITPEAHENEEYWRGVRSAYHELAKELRRTVEDDPQ